MSIARLSTVLEELLEAPPSEELTEACETDWRGRLPGWLLANFAPQVSPAESRSWLRRWRWASPMKRREMEDQAGWELSEWLYWFSASNDFWHIVRVSTESSSATISLAAADDVIPTQALEWLVEKSGARVVLVDSRGDSL